MRTWRRVLTSSCLVGLAVLFGQQAARAQSGMEFQHGAPPKENTAPAASLESLPALPGVPGLTVTRPQGVAHIMPTVSLAAQRQKALARPGVNINSGPLIYHAGGQIMLPYAAMYIIYWAPAQLQNGGQTGFSPKYGVVNTLLGAWYAGHGLGSNSTQYFQTINSTTTYSQNNGGLGGIFIDQTTPYPASGCNDPAPRNPLFPTGINVSGTNCINDSQIQAEVQHAIAVNSWPNGGFNNMFLVFTSSGENSCFDSSSTQCSYQVYCAYHSFISNGPSPIIYGNEPFGDPSTCANTTSFPNENFSDIAANVASHEMTEAMTDPLLNAWFDSSGNEIGDLCNFNFGTNTWDSGLANQMWNGFFFLLQQEFDNHTGTCVQTGP